MYVVIINIAVGISECKINVRDCVKEWEQIVFEKEVLILVHQGIILGVLWWIYTDFTYVYCYILYKSELRKVHKAT